MPLVGDTGPAPTIPTKPKPKKPAGPPSWEQMFYADIGGKGKITAQDQAFLTAWLQAEGPSSLGYNNPLNTTGNFAGWTGDINSAGVSSFGTLAQGVAANARALQENHPGYNVLLNMLRQGNVDPSVMANQLAQTPWGTGSGASRVLAGWGDKLPQGYQALAGYAGAQGAQNLPASLTAQAQAGNITNQIGLNQLLTGQEAQFAQQMAGFQKQNLGLSQQQLGIEQGALARQFGLVPKEYGLERKQFAIEERGLKAQRADTQREFANQLTNLVSAGAAGGSLFTKGQRDTTKLVHQREKSALGQISRAQQSLGLTEKGAALQFHEHMAALRDEKKNLGILAKRYGISEQEISARLKNTLNELNISGQSTAADLAAQLVGANMQQMSAATPYLPIGFPGLGGLGGSTTYPGGP